ncbi:hypothetical protein [Oceanospirillum sediminis]|uniref:Uncharacterized protein n=1 Tax=Oceanospirillum sediminis TaxID=2760088 RepID=A0A839IXI4_9GAMM|nr:hypothetical protein [Oceanospirillum sediminis]MBB1489159.1 hypothetical protein [Oceanospirillum sediminis]
MIDAPIASDRPVTTNNTRKMQKDAEYQIRVQPVGDAVFRDKILKYKELNSGVSVFHFLRSSGQERSNLAAIYAAYKICFDADSYSERSEYVFKNKSEKIIQVKDIYKTGVMYDLFCFRFAVEVSIDGKWVPFLFTLHNRGDLLSTSLYSYEVLSPHIATHLLQMIDCYLYGYSRGVIKRHAVSAPDFFRVIESEQIILGCDQGLFYENRFDDPEVFQSTLQYWNSSFTAESEKWPSVATKGWLEACM